MLVIRLPISICLVFILFVGALAQGQPAVQSQQSTAPAVTAAVSKPDTVRVTAPGEVTQIRLEVYGANGDVVFDSGMKSGNIIDWRLADAAVALTDGSFMIAVTTKDLYNKSRQRLGGLSLQAGQLTLTRGEELTALQRESLDSRRKSQKVDAGEGQESITIVTVGKERSVVVTAHDGQQGQVSSTNGPLTLNTGDTLTGQDKEQMRITPDGRVGIGTSKPQATLDVAGEIRAQGGIRFSDGSLLTSAHTSVIKNTTIQAAPSEAINAASIGTISQLSKWTDNAGTLGNSGISEDVNGNIGIGTNAPAGVFDLRRADSTDILQRYWNTGIGGAKLRYVAGVGATSQMQLTDTDEWLSSIAGNSAIGMQFRVRANGVANDEATLNNSARMSILRNGNVGIGTTTPTQRLEVAGNLKLTGVGNALFFPDGTSMSTAAVGNGATPSGTSIVNAINDPGTVGLIGDGRLAPNVARLNGANAWSGVNVFGAGLSANNSLVTNVANPINAGDAVNKAYADANFIKFVPGAEQLSVGDANGTAPMINLRGGSTCCSGPGGHTPAWFKVFQNGSFVATGNLGIGVSPMQGKGYRTSWDSYKGAFRSGYADNEWDDANVGFFSWAGGSNSTAIGLYALAFGDTNQAESTSSIVFGSGNQVKGAAGFAAGAGNRVCDTYGAALGNNAKSGGPYINGKCDPDSFNLRGLAAMAFGYNVTADQDHTTAMGKFASNNGFQGTFIWSDGSATASADTFRNTANNEFAARATGGFRFRTNLGGTTGCNLPAGSGVFNCTSSRYTKENFLNVDGEDVLSRLRKIPVSTWNYTSEGQSVRHMGPMAEDFFEGFRLGTGNTSIGVQDLAGVSLGAIRALDLRTTELQQKNTEVEQLKQQVNELRHANEAMEKRLEVLEQRLTKADSDSEK